MKTYHLFCLETLTAHGRLLSGQQAAFLYPGDERLRKSTFDGDWNAERLRLSTEEGIYCLTSLRRRLPHFLRNARRDAGF